MTLPKERRVQAKLAVKDEYTFDFAELSPEYSEHELETEVPLYRGPVTTFAIPAF